MTSKIITAKLNDDINYTIDVMKNNNIRHMPVLDANNRLTDFFSIRDFLRAEMQDNVEIKQKHKNVVRYQIMVSVLLIGTTAAGVFFDFFERKNLVVIFSALFLIIGISAVMTIRSNKRYNRED
jgi:CBS-domain-containing membrane protein